MCVKSVTPLILLYTQTLAIMLMLLCRVGHAGAWTLVAVFSPHSHLADHEFTDTTISFSGKVDTLSKI